MAVLHTCAMLAVQSCPALVSGVPCSVLVTSACLTVETFCCLEEHPHQSACGYSAISCTKCCMFLETRDTHTHVWSCVHRQSLLFATCCNSDPCTPLKHTTCCCGITPPCCMLCGATLISAACMNSCTVFLQHNTCPVCRKELPVDQELQQQQQQERQQRFQQEVQRQPAGLQSLFSALNPFHLFAGGPFPAAGQHGGAAAGQAGPHQGNAAAADAAPPANSNQMPVGTMERFEVVQTSLRELEVNSMLLSVHASTLGCSCSFDTACVSCFGAL